MKSNDRSSNIELLRIFAMFMIVLYHIVCHSVVVQLENQPFIEIGKKYFVINAFYPWGTTGNNIFLITSGYFLVSKGKSIDLAKISKKLLSQLFFASIALVFVSNLAFRIARDTNNIRIENFMDVNNGRSWFIGYYFLVIVIAYLLLNNILLKLEKEKYMMFLFTSFAVIQFSWSAGFLNGIGSGGGLKILLTGIFMYSLGGYIRKYDPFNRVRTFSFFLIVAALYVMIYITTVNYKEVLRYSDSHFLVIVLAVCMFELFSRIKIPKIQFVNFVGSATFMIYLFHDCPFFYRLWDMNNWIELLRNEPAQFVITLLLWGIVSFGAGVLGYIVYIIFMKAWDKSKILFIRR